MHSYIHCVCVTVRVTQLKTIIYATLSATETGNAVRVHYMAGWSCVPTDLEHSYPACPIVC